MSTVIRNPNDPDHEMRVERETARIHVTRAGMMLANSRHALRVSERSARGEAAPVIYFPRSDLTLPLGRVDGKSTHCPLKGDAVYYEIGDQIVAWSYEHPLEFAAIIKGYMAFYPDQVEIEQMR